MNKTYPLAVFVLVIIIAGVWYFNTSKRAVAPTNTHNQTQTTADTATTTQNFGTYAYECDEHVAFELTLASDVSSMHVKAAGIGVYPPETTLTKKTSVSGVRYEGNGVVLTAKGETVTLGEGDSAINCSPVPNPNSAPFNFGD